MSLASGCATCLRNGAIKRPGRLFGTGAVLVNILGVEGGVRRPGLRSAADGLADLRCDMSQVRKPSIAMINGPALCSGTVSHREPVSEGPSAAGDEHGGALLQPDMRAVKSDRPGPKRIGKPEPHLPAPEIGPNDEAKAPVARAGLGRGKGEARIGLRRRVADRVRALHRACPGRYPFLRGLRQGGGSVDCGYQRQY
jgi:hypothetical protein